MGNESPGAEKKCAGGILPSCLTKTRNATQESSKIVCLSRPIRFVPFPVAKSRTAPPRVFTPTTQCH